MAVTVYYIAARLKTFVYRTIKAIYQYNMLMSDDANAAVGQFLISFHLRPFHLHYALFNFS